MTTMAFGLDLVPNVLRRGVPDLTGCRNLRKMLSGLQAELDAVNPQVRSRRNVTTQVLQQISVWRAQGLGRRRFDLQRMVAGQSASLLVTRAINGVVDMGPWLFTAMGESAFTQWLASFTDPLPECLDAPQRAERMHDIERESDMVATAEEARLRDAEDNVHPVDPQLDCDLRAGAGGGKVNAFETALASAPAPTIASHVWQISRQSACPFHCAKPRARAWSIAHQFTPSVSRLQALRSAFCMRTSSASSRPKPSQSASS